MVQGPYFRRPGHRVTDGRPPRRTRTEPTISRGVMELTGLEPGRLVANRPSPPRITPNPSASSSSVLFFLFPSKPSARSRALTLPNEETPLASGESSSRLLLPPRPPPHPLILFRHSGGSRSPPGANLQNPKPWRGRVGAGRRRVGRPPWRPSTAATWSSTRSGSSSPT